MGGIGGGAGFALFLPFVDTSTTDDEELKGQFFSFSLWMAIIFSLIYLVCLLIYRAKPLIPPTYLHENKDE
jgi:hypothetical protein